MLTYGIPPEFRGGVHLFIYNRHTPSGQSRVYRVTQLRTDGVHCRESARRHGASKSQGSSERVLPWQVTMDRLIFASLSHTPHYWYEVGMLKVQATMKARTAERRWMRNPVRPSSCVTPAGTSNELDVQNEWEENTHTHTTNSIRYYCCTLPGNKLSIFPSNFFVSFPLSLCMESTSYVLSFRMVFFYLMTTGWIFDISAYYVRIQSNKNQKV